MNLNLISLFLIAFLLVSAFNSHAGNSEHVISSHNYTKDFPAMDNEGNINVIIEIPAGCNQKWEVNTTTGFIEWEQITEDSFRLVQYLPYPANYGMIPKTFLPEDLGGDGDAIDVFLLGPAIERGEVVKARVIGVIKMLDRGEQDDKIIAVPLHSWFEGIDDIDKLEQRYSGVIDILSLWLINYKGVDDIIEIQHIGSSSEAVEILEKSIEAYRIFKEN